MRAMSGELWLGLAAALSLLALYFGELRDRQQRRDEEQRKRIAKKARAGHYDERGRP